MLLTGLTLGLALAMDAFCVSFADSMARPDMKHRQLFLIALVFGVFQTIMPLIGSLLIRFVDDSISAVHPYIKYVAAAVFAFLAFNIGWFSSNFLPFFASLFSINFCFSGF